MNIQTYLIFAISISIHSCLSLTLARRIVKGQRFHASILYIVSLINGFTAPFFLDNLSISPVLSYNVIIAVFLIEAFLLFRDRYIGILGLMTGVFLHMYTLRPIVIGVHSLYTGNSMYDILHTQNLFETNTLAFIWVHIVVLIAFITFVPPKAVKHIILNNLLVKPITLLMSFITVFHIYNVTIYKVDADIMQLAVQQIVLSILLLGAFYTMLIFMIMLVSQDKYSKIIAELEKKVDKTEMLTNALFNFAEVVVEYNCTTNLTTRVIIHSKELTLDTFSDFSEHLTSEYLSLVHPKDVHKLIEIVPENLVKKYKKGERETLIEFRSYGIGFNENGNSVNIDRSDYFWYRLRINTRRDTESGDILALSTLDEITEEKEKELHLVKQSEVDPLTGAYNKIAMQNKISEYLEDGGKEGTLFVFDIDNFKSINDTLGHAHGDETLVDIYGIINHLFRSDDYIGRFGGDEYVAFVRNHLSPEDTHRMAERICESLHKTYVSDDGEAVTISTSIGISVAPKDGETYDDLFRAADIALYMSKNRGKNTYTIYSKNQSN